MGYKSGLWRGHSTLRLVSKTLQHFLHCILQVIVMLKGELSPQTEVACTQVFLMDLSVTCLTKALLAQLFSLVRRPTLERVLVVPNFHFTIIEATVLLGKLKSLEMVLYPACPDLCLATILSTERSPWISWLCPDIQCEMCDLIYTGVCLYKLSNQLNLPQLVSNQVQDTYISRIIKANRMHLTTI